MPKKKPNTDKIADFLFEVGMLTKTPRSFSPFLGGGEQSVADHSLRTAYIGLSLGQMIGGVDLDKIIKMALFHDLTEARISDLNHLHQRYAYRDEHKALDDLAREIPFGKYIKDIVVEYEKRKSMEAIIVKDADILEFLITLKEVGDTGNIRAKNWAPMHQKRLKTKEAKALAKSILKTKSDSWWFRP